MKKAPLKVYFFDKLAGFLEEHENYSTSFSYDTNFLKQAKLPISINLPLQESPFLNKNGLHPFFDNLVAEGWLAELQNKSLANKNNSRFQLLAAFGSQCMGAVHTEEDLDSPREIELVLDDKQAQAAIKAKMSISGVQPKLVVKKSGRKFHQCKNSDHSTHIAKFASNIYPKIIENEYITTIATQSLLGKEEAVEVEIGKIDGIPQEALLVKRFDRKPDGGKIHFEEFNQLLNLSSEDKYNGSYEEISDFINTNEYCIQTDLAKFLKRLLVCILLGNNDAHLKNFAMIYTENGLRMSPCYDMVFSEHYGLHDLALNINNQSLRIQDIKAKTIWNFAQNSKINKLLLENTFHDLEARLEKTLDLILEQKNLDFDISNKLIKQVKKRWNGTLSPIKNLIGKK